jgi:pilus assembly protein CpaE
MARSRGPGAQRTDDERGQASVELLGVLPAALLLALVGWQLVLAGHALWLAGNAARVGARAKAVGFDPAAAARSSLPSYLRRELRVTERGDEVRVGVHPPWVIGRSPAPLELSARASMRRQSP